MRDRYQTFAQYWPHYVENHKRRLTRRLHFISLLLYFLSWLPGLFWSFWWGVPASLLLGYLFAFYTHRYIEKSPINVHHKRWGLVANLYMFWLILTRHMDAEMVRLYGEADPAPDKALSAALRSE